MNRPVGNKCKIGVNHMFRDSTIVRKVMMHRVALLCLLLLLTTGCANVEERVTRSCGLSESSLTFGDYTLHGRNQDFVISSRGRDKSPEYEWPTVECILRGVGADSAVIEEAYRGWTTSFDNFTDDHYNSRRCGLIRGNTWSVMVRKGSSGLGGWIDISNGNLDSMAIGLHRC
jgi:hypothetical protein